MFFLLIILVGGGAIFMVYQIMFPAGYSEKERASAAAEVQQIEGLQKELSSARAELAETKKKMAVKDKEKEEIKAVADKTQVQKQAAQDRVKFLEQEALAAESSFKEEKDSFLKKEEVLRNRIQDNEAELKQVREKIQINQECVSELSKIKEDLKTKDGQINDLQSQVNASCSKINSLEAELTVKIEEINSLKQQLEAKPVMSQQSPVIQEIPLSQEASVVEEVVPSQPAEAPLNEREDQILQYLKEYVRITRQEYMEKFNVSRATSSRDLRQLEEKNLIQPYGPAGRGRYFVLKQASDIGEEKTEEEREKPVISDQ